MTPLRVTSLFLCAIAAAHSRLNAEGDHLRPLESLPFFQGGRHSWSLTQAKRWRQNLLTRQRFHWSNPVAGTIKVFVRPPRWLKPDFGVNESCEVACDYTRSLDSAHVALSMYYMRPIAPRNGSVVNAIMSFEPQQLRRRLTFSLKLYLIWTGTCSAWLANVLASRTLGVRMSNTSSYRGRQ